MAAATTQAAVAAGAAPKPKRELPVMSRDEIEALIADGRKIIIYEGEVLKVDYWMKYHPGGDLAIEHMVGRDGTDEMTVLHSAEAIQLMKKYRIGKIEGAWKNFVPPIQGGIFRTIAQIKAGEEGQISNDADSSSTSSRAPSPVFDTDDAGLRQRVGAPTPSSASSAPSEADSAKGEDGMAFLDRLTQEHITLDLDKYPLLEEETQAAIVEKYRALHQRIRDEGLYQCNYWAYGVECIRYIAAFVGMLLGIHFGWYKTAALSLGFMWHQLVFTAHDAGHMGITHNFQIDSCIGIFIADFVGGLSMGWWKRSHNVHHIVTNAPEHDPDIEHLPFFAISHRFFNSLKSTYYNHVMKYDAFSKVLIRFQPWLYYPILSLARFNLCRLSWDYLIMGRGPKSGPAAWHRWLEIAGQGFFWTWYGYGIIYCCLPDNWTRFSFFMISNITPSPLHLQIVLSHFAMSTADLGPGESFPQKMLRTTMDVDCPPWLDFLHGGLQFQAIHHLFPRIPRHNLRKTQSLVQDFCDEVGIPYALYGFTSVNKQVIGRLADVSRQAAILAKCQKAIMQSGDPLGHH